MAGAKTHHVKIG